MKSLQGRRTPGSRDECRTAPNGRRPLQVTSYKLKILVVPPAVTINSSLIGQEQVAYKPDQAVVELGRSGNLGDRDGRVDLIGSGNPP